MSSTPAIIAEVLRGRRSVNDFLPEQPPAAAVLRAIELARWAPNHKLTEPWRFHWIGPQTAAAIVELNTRLVAATKGADAAETKHKKWSAIPGWLVVTCAQSEDPLRSREEYAACCCAIQNLMLALWSEGIGTKWTTGDVTRHPEFATRLRFDAAERDVVGLVWYGYPATVPTARRGEVETFIARLP